MKKLAATLAFALLSFNAFSADTVKIPSVKDGNALASASNPFLQTCYTKNTGNTMSCSALGSLPSYAYRSVTSIASEMASYGCDNLGSGIYHCSASASISQQFGGPVLVWSFQDNGYLGGIYIFINN